MTPQETILAFRDQAHDNRGTTEEEFLWKTPFLYRVLNEARMQAARRARLIMDTSSALTKLAVKTTSDTLKLDKRIILVKRVKHSLIDRPLPKLAWEDADNVYPGWESQTASEPVAWIPWGDHEMRLTPPPDTAATINMIVIREPLESVTASGDEDAMEIEPRYHHALVDWMCFRAYMQRDLLEKYRPEEARDRLGMFEGEFGPATAAIQEKWSHRKHGYDEFEGLL